MTAIAFLGAGNIAQAIMGGLIEDGFSGTICASDPAEPCRAAAQALGVSIVDSNDQAIASADVVMLCVKPNVVTQLLEALAEVITDQLFISVAAGVTINNMQQRCPAGTALVRCMPNTPALVQTGMTALYANEHTSEAQKQTAEKILGAVGKTIWVNSETELDAVTAVSGSGPAYFFLMMESMIEAAISEGLSPDVAETLVLQTALGAARMADASDTGPATLRTQVTSPGGTTQAALESFEAGGYRALVKSAVAAARLRSVELSAS